MRPPYLYGPMNNVYREAAEWYLGHESEVNKKAYFDYIDANLLD